LDNLKYAVPTFYELFKTSGSTLKDEKRGLGLMLQYFSGHFIDFDLSRRESGTD
jgi:hypothetical protein